MPILRYKYWASDPAVVRKAIVANREYLFEKVREGTCRIASLADAHWLLRNSVNYEVAQWCEVCEGAASVEREAVSVETGVDIDTTSPERPRRGRPRTR